MAITLIITEIFQSAFINYEPSITFSSFSLYSLSASFVILRGEQSTTPSSLSSKMKKLLPCERE